MSIRLWLHVATALLLAASAALGVDAFLSLRMLRRPEAPPAAARAAAGGGAPAEKRAKKDRSVIVRRNLFASTPLVSAAAGGGAAGGGRAVPPPHRKAPEAKAARNGSRLSDLTQKYRLVGTTVVPGEKGYAILEEKGSGRSTVYREGEEVEGVRIREVRRGEVALSVDGQEGVLKAFDEKAAGPSAGAAPGVPLPPGPGGRARPPRAAPPHPAGARRRVLSRAALARMVGAAERAGDNIRFEPYHGPRGDVGVRLFPLRPGGLMPLLGLRAGDVLLSLDGAPVAGGAAFDAALEALKERPGFRMKILRGGKETEISYILR